MYGKEVAKLRDIMDIIAPEDAKNKLLETDILVRKDKTQTFHLVSITDIINKILSKYPNAKVNNLGEKDILIEFKPKKKEKSVWKFLKVTFVVVVLLTGSSTAIMSFHSDAQMTQIFRNYSKILLGEDKEKPHIIDIPYSIGLAAGIIIFFNHFGGRKLTKDPTPIDVEMNLYDKDVNETLIANLEKKGKKDD
ncbi:MAG: stage V sporulation protein AA [Defluviitaleaceae bacterium]|nr:stage V sporulation protein AA [Defluviitaleaceae bacterium]